MIYCENVVKILWTWQLFFLLFHRFPNIFFFHFRQCHCHNCQKFIPPILAMALPQLPIFFFPHHLVFLACTHTSSTHPDRRYGQKKLRQYHCRKSKISLLLFIFLSPTFVEFRQWYCHNSLSFFRLLNKLK